MNYAYKRGEDHLEAARNLAHRLFSEENVRLGLRDSINKISMQIDQVLANHNQTCERG